MTNEEAREILVGLEVDYRDLDSLILTDDSIQLVNKRVDALGVAISALAKQIPKKPKEIPVKENNNLWHLYCSSCKNWIGMWNSRLKHGDMYNISNGKICPYCGQAIDWRKNDG